MIISASRRTDIPAFYSDWFFNRLREGYVLVRNPMNPHQIGRVDLMPETVDGIVFWTKNPLPMLDKLYLLREYSFYFQFTVTSYGIDVEPAVPSKNKAMIPAFCRLSEQLGPERVIWRYDPIFLTPKYSAEYHAEYFEKMARRLAGYTCRCTISFLDYYRGTARRLAGLSPLPFSEAEQRKLGGLLAEICRSYGLEVDACAEMQDFRDLGIGRARCIDAGLLGRLRGRPLQIPKDKNQRPECGCAASVDIGAYDTCRSGCLYCYAHHSDLALQRNCASHDPMSPLLVGKPEPEDKIRDRKNP
ncbi:MAG: DUF1848 domain-containing protein [Clostridiaceae bacterium]|nr:DUF1848 domain-containing protein [Clostridiaceae bacterium]